MVDRATLRLVLREAGWSDSERRSDCTLHWRLVSWQGGWFWGASFSSTPDRIAHTPSASNQTVAGCGAAKGVGRGAFDGLLESVGFEAEKGVEVPAVTSVEVVAVGAVRSRDGRVVCFEQGGVATLRCDEGNAASCTVTAFAGHGPRRVPADEELPYADYSCARWWIPPPS